MNGKSEYERQRLARLQRNRQVMKELGLATSTTSVQSKPTPKAVKSASDVQSLRQSSRLAKLPRTDFYEPSTIVTRKSARLNKVDEEEEEDDKVETTTEVKRSRKTKLSPEEIEEAMASAEYLDTSHRPSSSSTTKSRSCVDIDAHLDELRSVWIGKVFRPPGTSGAMKETVMNQIGVENPVFSKYSGLQEFKNAIILFVNVGGREYENLFYTNGTATSAVSLDWYASSKAKPDSRAIQRLSTATEEREDFGVFLFLRFEGEPYLCCGPCLVEEKDLDPRPMRFRLKILNTAAIMTRAWKLFDQLLKGQREEEES